MGCLRRRAPPAMNASSAESSSLIPSRFEIQAGIACSLLFALSSQKAQTGSGFPISWGASHMSLPFGLTISALHCGQRAWFSKRTSRGGGK